VSGGGVCIWEIAGAFTGLALAQAVDVCEVEQLCGGRRGLSGLL